MLSDSPWKARWRAVGTLPLTALTEPRIQLHWAAQAVAAAGHGLLEPRSDDSQSNLGWSVDHEAFIGHELPGGARVGLRVPVLELLVLRADGPAATFSLEGRRLRDALDWLGEELQKCGASPDAQPLQLRDYDLPESPIGDGEAFAPTEAVASRELSCWFGGAFAALSAVIAAEACTTELRVWPHHFDVGVLSLLDPSEGLETGRSIGLGMSPGDAALPQPYFYVNPYGARARGVLPPLRGGGTWQTEGFFGAVLRGETLTEADSGEAQAELVGGFLDSALTAAHQLLV